MVPKYFKRYSTLITYSAASLSVNFVSLISGFIVLRWILPAEYGLWQSLLVIQSYSLIVQGGVVNGLNRELPYTMGKDDNENVALLAGSAQSIAFIGAGFLLALAVACPFVIDSHKIAWTTSMVFVCSSALLLRSYLMSTYRAGRSFDILGRIMFFEAVCSFFSLPFVYYFGYNGLVGRVVFLNILILVVSYYFRPLKVSFCFSRESIFTLIKVGTPIFCFGYLFSVSATFPKLILLSYSGAEMVGAFAPALAIISLFNMLPVAVATYIYPHMSFALGRSGDPITIWPTAWKSAIAMLCAGIIVFIIGWFTAGPLISSFLPKYEQSVPAIRWCLAAGVFLGPRIAVNALFALKAWGWSVVYTFALVLSYLSLPWLGIRSTANPLVGLSMGILSSNFLVFIVGMICIYKATHKRAVH